MSWPLVALGDVVDFRRATVSAVSIASGTTYVGLEHITGEGAFEGVGDVQQGELGSSKFAFSPEHVLFGKLRPYLKKIARPGFSGVCSTDILPLRPKAVMDRDYLFHILRRQEFIDLVVARSAGANLPRIAPDVLAELAVPLPPLAEQRRIAAILDKADALRAKRRVAIAKLDQLLQSVFLDMFGDPVKNPKGWPMKPFTDVGAWISGATPSKSEGRFWHGAIPWVSPKDMKRALIDDAEDHVTDTAFKESNLKLVMPGHLLIVVRGMILAHSFPTAVNSVPIAINQDMKAIRPSKDFNVVYLKAAIDALKSRILGVVSTAGHGTRRLDTRDASEVLVPMPPKTEQESFARFVELNRRLFELSQSQKNVEQVLFSSIQHQAFSGLL